MLFYVIHCFSFMFFSYVHECIFYICDFKARRLWVKQAVEPGGLGSVHPAGLP